MSESTCNVIGCVNPPFGRGWCKKHHTRWLRHGDPLKSSGSIEWTEDDVPWNKVFGNRHRVTDSGCWEWTGYVTPAGYGKFRYMNKTEYTHRISYGLVNGAFDDQLTVDHLCFNPPCIRPEHLRLLTNSENAGNQRTAWLPVCIRGHEWNEANTYWRTRRGRQQRKCKACGLENQRARRTAGEP